MVHGLKDGRNKGKSKVTIERKREGESMVCEECEA